MVLTDMTDAPIPRPIGKHGAGRHSLIVYKGLAKAVRRESNQAELPAFVAKIMCLFAA